VSVPADGGGARTVLAVGCHPDDIEFMMAGTLLLLRDRGWTVHYFNVADGSCGTERLPADEIAALRLAEAREAARLLGAEHHAPVARDLEVLYQAPLVRAIAAVVRSARPRIVLTQSLEDYMADHMRAARATVTAAFSRGMRNFASDPPVPAANWDLALYHATPHTLRDMMRRPIVPERFVDVAPVMERKAALLATILARSVPFLAANTFPASIALVAVTLFGLGAAKTKVTGRPWLASGLETLVVGGITAAAAWGVGKLLGGLA